MGFLEVVMGLNKIKVEEENVKSKMVDLFFSSFSFLVKDFLIFLLEFFYLFSLFLFFSFSLIFNLEETRWCDNV